jgi:hypothetical protein
MFDATVVRHDKPGTDSYCKLLVEMQDHDRFLEFLDNMGLPEAKIQRPKAEEIEEYKEWGDPDLCLTYWAMVPEDKMGMLQEHAQGFVDQR